VDHELVHGLERTVVFGSADLHDSCNALQRECFRQECNCPTCLWRWLGFISKFSVVRDVVGWVHENLPLGLLAVRRKAQLHRMKCRRNPSSSTCPLCDMTIVIVSKILA
jgi:hypothetical protein